MKYIYIALLFFYSLLSTNIIYSQDSFDNVLYLKNGSIINCKIIELIPNKSIRILTRTNDVFVYEYSEIDKIEKSKSFKKYDGPVLEENTYNLIEKITNISRIGLARNANNETIYFSISNVFGYQFKYFSLGLGLMYDAYTNNSFIPIFADTRIYLSNSKTKPYFLGDIGYSFGTNIGKGMMFSLGVGIRSILTNSTDFIVELGYKSQNIKFKIYNFNISGDAEFITLNTGLQF
jgi:hypothetical protein